MILKEADAIETDNILELAGTAAERQMAFYLRRAFADEKMFMVLNGLRLKAGDDVCQIDHLVIHGYGMVIVESKSVTSKVKINDDGSWERVWDNHWRGMASPVIQAGMQAAFLKKRLNLNKEHLLRKVLGIQMSFDKLPIQVVVAISDNGRIERSGHPENSLTLKADQVVDRIREIYAAEKKKDTILTLVPKAPDFMFSERSMRRVADFLLANHFPCGARPVRKLPLRRPSPISLNPFLP